MKKLLALALSALFALSLAACAGTAGDPAPTDPPLASMPAATASPTERIDLSFDPDTDYVNAYGGLTAHDLVETEDAVYWHSTNGRAYLYYYDKACGESGVLCPRPECLHDAVENNRDCAGYLGTFDPSLSFFEGKLWWIGYCGPNEADRAIYRMDPDGTNREKVRDLSREHEYQGTKYYFHRGYIYFYRADNIVRQGSLTLRISVSRMPLDSDKLEVIWEATSAYVPQATLRFRGGEIYIFAQFDGGDENTSAEELAALSYRLEILRWTEGMTEPECLCRVDNAVRLMNVAAYDVTKSGEIYFAVPSSDGERRGDAVCRVSGDGSSEELFDFFDEENPFHIMSITDGIVCASAYLQDSQGGRIFWIRDISGETLFKGRLPAELAPGTEASVSILTADRGHLTAYAAAKDPEDPLHYGLFCLIRYDLTADGPVGTALITVRRRIAVSGD